MRRRASRRRVRAGNARIEPARTPRRSAPGSLRASERLDFLRTGIGGFVDRTARSIGLGRLAAGSTQAEQARQRLRVRANGLRVAQRLELLGGRQQQLLDDEMGDFV